MSQLIVGEFVVGNTVAMTSEFGSAYMRVKCVAVDENPVPNGVFWIEKEWRMPANT